MTSRGVRRYCLTFIKDSVNLFKERTCKRRRIHLNIYNILPLTNDEKVASDFQKLLPCSVKLFSGIEGSSLTAEKVISQAQKATIADIRAVADLLDLIILPLPYVHEKAFLSEANEETRKNIKGFIDGLGRWFVFYLLAPHSYYSIEKHVYTKNNNFDIYASEKFRQTFLSLELTVPLLRSMCKSIEKLGVEAEEIRQTIKREIKKIEERIEKVEGSMITKGQLYKAFSFFRQYVDTKEKEVIRSCQPITPYSVHDHGWADHVAEKAAKDAECSMNRSLKGLSDTIRCANGKDPLIFAVIKPDADIYLKKEASFFDTAIIGPCWGPEFDSERAEILKEAEVPEQRECLDLLMNKWKDLPKRITAEIEKNKKSVEKSLAEYQNRRNR